MAGKTVDQQIEEAKQRIHQKIDAHAELANHMLDEHADSAIKGHRYQPVTEAERASYDKVKEARYDQIDNGLPVGTTRVSRERAAATHGKHTDRLLEKRQAMEENPSLGSRSI